MIERCGMVSPFWVDLGWVQWSGTSQREKLFGIDYKRCASIETTLTVKYGSPAHLCVEHAPPPAISSASQGNKT